MSIETEDLIEAIRIFFEVELPPLLLSDSLDDFQGYIGEPPYAVDERQLAFYMGGGNDSESNASETIRGQAQLPRIQNPVKYHDAIWKVLKKFDSDSVGFSSKALAHEPYYPGEIGDGGAGSFLLYEISFYKELDDCEI